ncbi:MAG: hypothetical protein ACKOQ4_03250 [Mycobacterium sp.]
MKSITVIAEQLSGRALAAALPAAGVASAVVSRNPDSARGYAAMVNYQALRDPRRFSPNFRIDLLVEDAAVESVFDGFAVAYGAGLFSDAEMWVNEAAPEAAA